MKRIIVCFALCASMNAQAQTYTYDVNGDGNVDIQDVTCLTNHLLGKLNPGEMSAEHEYVDLGLPSGTLWATCNVGANSPEECGDYFAWGETCPQADKTYYWTSYKWCNGSYDTQTKYCTSSSYGAIDDRLELEKDDDAAYVNWGSDWRTPSYSQQTELRTNCTWTWSEKNGINGYEVKGKNGNSIFLPASGCYINYSINNMDSWGYYWSRTLTSTSNYNASCMNFSSGTIDWNVSDRYRGYSVRPIRLLDHSNLLPGKFTVNADGKQVQFAKSNLCWDGSTFKFEENQTDYQTSWDASHVSHFYWTSLTDYQSGTASYMPYAESYNYSRQSTSDKFWCGEDNPLTVEGTSGLYALTGGSSGEWYYLIKSRTNASNLCKYGVTVTNGGISYTNCLIIAPDEFTGTLQSSYTLDEVNAAGLVCLPAAGYRDDSSLNGGGSYGGYWSASPYSSGSLYAYYLLFNHSYIYPASDYDSRYGGRCLRLVHNVE